MFLDFIANECLVLERVEPRIELHYPISGYGEINSNGKQKKDVSNFLGA